MIVTLMSITAAPAVITPAADVAAGMTRCMKEYSLKRKTARELLAESFRELAQNKSIDRITVQEIVENCGYSPATFYRQFRDKYDLIAWDYTRGVAEIMNRVGRDGYTWEQALLDGAKGFCAYKDYLANLFLHTSGHDAFILYMTDINCGALKKHIMETTGAAALDEATEMYIRTYCMGTVSLTCEWILGKYKAGPEELAEIYKNALPPPLHPLLYEK